MKTIRWIVLFVLTIATCNLTRAEERPWLEFDRAISREYAKEYAINVRAVQSLLRARGYKITADGVFGTQTENALKNFQRKRGHVASGKVNNATWEALVISLQPGARGDAVRAMQILLNGFVDKPLKIDGVYGAQTKVALLKFQKDMNTKADGIVGKATWSKLSPGQWEGC